MAVPKFDVVRDKGVGEPLEYGLVQLHLVGLPLGLHLPSVAEEDLGVPELRLNLCLHVHGVNHGLALLLTLAIRPFCDVCEVAACVNDKEEV